MADELDTKLSEARWIPRERRDVAAFGGPVPELTVFETVEVAMSLRRLARRRQIDAALARRPRVARLLPRSPNDPGLPAEARELWDSLDPKERARAREPLERCVERTPRAASCWRALASVLVRDPRADAATLDRARQAYRRALELSSPDEPTPFKMLPWVDYPTPPSPR